MLLGICQENNHSALCIFYYMAKNIYIYMQEKYLSTIEFLKKLQYCLHIDREIVIMNNFQKYEAIYEEVYISL